MVYRPPKSKPLPSRAGAGFPANQPDADPLEGPLQAKPLPGDPRAGDDRNLVLVDSDLAEADFEDRLWLFWQRRREFILWGITLAFAAAAAWQGYLFYQRSQVQGLQEAYLAAAAGGEAGLQAFGREKSTTPLGKAALLEAADLLYKAGKYTEAAAAYEEAGTAWGPTESSGQRARFGAAVSRVIAGGDSLAAGRSELDAISNDFQAADNWRGQAVYFLICLAVQSGDMEGAKTLREKYQTIPSPLWSSASDRLIEGATLMAAGTPGQISAATPANTPSPATDALGVLLGPANTPAGSGLLPVESGAPAPSPAAMSSSTMAPAPSPPAASTSPASAAPPPVDSQPTAQ